MLRHLVSLTFPVLLSAVAALSYLHFRREGHIVAAPVQLAQAEPADPFAPPKDPAAPPAAEVKPVDPAPPAPRLAPKTTVKRTRREAPKADDEVRTPFLRSLLGQLDGFTEISAEERDGVRQMIYEADNELYDSTGPNARRKIEAANRKRGFVVGASRPRTASDPPTKRADVLRQLEAAPPRDRAVDPVPPAVEPKPDEFNDLFKPQ